jgi:RHS repeat-associated protein
MQLSSGSHIPDGLLAAMTLRNENSRLGVPSKNPALHQGIDASKSKNAMGLQTVTTTTRVRSRCTGKERDAESNLDYFGARYYGSSMGRFTSPDDGSDQLTGEPQSWNLYSYGRNNPVTNTDADGRSVSICSANSFGDQQCQTISDDAYKAAQQASNSGGLSGTSLSNLQNSASGAGTITDSSGATVGTVQWTADNPGIQGPGAAQAFGNIGNQGMGAIKAFTVGSIVGGTLGGGALALSGSGVAATISLNIVNTARVAGATLAGGWKVGQQMARTGATSPAGVLDFAKNTMTTAIQEGQVVQTQFGTIYRDGSNYVVQNSQNVISSIVVNAEAGKGIVAEYFNRGGK